MGIAGLNLKFNKKVKTNVERESIFIFKGLNWIMALLPQICDISLQSIGATIL